MYKIKALWDGKGQIPCYQIDQFKLTLLARSSSHPAAVWQKSSETWHTPGSSAHLSDQTWALDSHTECLPAFSSYSSCGFLVLLFCCCCLHPIYGKKWIKYYKITSFFLFLFKRKRHMALKKIKAGLRIVNYFFKWLNNFILLWVQVN